MPLFIPRPLAGGAVPPSLKVSRFEKPSHCEHPSIHGLSSGFPSVHCSPPLLGALAVARVAFNRPRRRCILRAQSKARERSQAEARRELTGLSYITDLLPREDFKAVVAEYRQCRKYLADEGPSLAMGRKAVFAPEGGVAERVFFTEQVLGRLRCALSLQESLALAPEFPIEYREYTPAPGAAMLWHSDEVLMEPPQLELVYTLENLSDSVTRWAASHADVLRGLIDEVWTRPNSGLVVRAGGPVHMVAQLTKGTRAIAKVVFAVGKSPQLTELGQETVEDFALPRPSLAFKDAAPRGTE